MEFKLLEFQLRQLRAVRRIRSSDAATVLCVATQTGLIKQCLLAVVGFFALVSLCGAASVQRPAMKVPLVSEALLTDSVQLSDRVVAVGAYGIIVYSTDGREWRQANVPTQRLLTTVSFINDREGWAGGHDTLILHTTDRGENWQIQHEDPIPDGDVPKPILDISFSDNLHGLAVGAFGLMLATKDGGKTWETVDTGPLYDRLEAEGMEPEPHFNAIGRLKDGFLIAGELGTLLHYNPQAESQEDAWRILASPYEGSFFGVNILPSGSAVIYGLRGNLFRSADAGNTWTKIQTDTTANLYGSTVLADGSLIAVGSVSTILRVEPGAAVAEKIPYPGFGDFAAVQALGQDELLLFGRGAQTLPLR